MPTKQIPQKNETDYTDQALQTLVNNSIPVGNPQDIFKTGQVNTNWNTEDPKTGITNVGEASAGFSGVGVHNTTTDPNTGMKIHSNIRVEFPVIFSALFKELDKIKINTASGDKISFGQVMGGITGGMMSAVGSIKNIINATDIKSLASGVIGTIGGLISGVAQFIPYGGVISGALSFLSSLFGGKAAKSPQQVISEQIGAMHKAMNQSFKVVFENQKLILKNMSIGFKNLSIKISTDGQLTRNAIQNVSDKITRSTEIIIDQIDNLRIELSDSIFGLQSSLNLNFGLLSMQLSDSVFGLRKELSAGFLDVQKTLSKQFSFVSADFKDFKFDNRFEFAKQTRSHGENDRRGSEYPYPIAASESWRESSQRSVYPHPNVAGESRRE